MKEREGGRLKEKKGKTELNLYGDLRLLIFKNNRIKAKFSY